MQTPKCLGVENQYKLARNSERCMFGPSFRLLLSGNKWSFATAMICLSQLTILKSNFENVLLHLFPYKPGVMEEQAANHFKLKSDCWGTTIAEGLRRQQSTTMSPFIVCNKMLKTYFKKEVTVGDKVDSGINDLWVVLHNILYGRFPKFQSLWKRKNQTAKTMTTIIRFRVIFSYLLVLAFLNNQDNWLT